MYTSSILPLAKQDIRDAAKWYNLQKPGLGKIFIKHVRQKIGFIKKHPYAVAIRYDDVRTAIVDLFPYMIHFTIEDDKKRIVISAVLSTHRDPDLWKKR